jgi:putative acyl-CoA dehydrogenase
VPFLRREPGLAREWEPRVTGSRYDPSSRPAGEKAGATIGMAMTEKQGGSDVRANSSRARPLSASGDYELVGHKWVCSAPMSDAFFTLAQTAAGLTCFFVPRWRPDGARNAVHIQRLKDKLGDRSNASAEIEYHGAWALRVGEEGEGVRTIIDMVQGTRLDCIGGSSALMRNALAAAIWHCNRRAAFGRLLAQQPAMQRVLADLALEQEAALTLAFRIARAFDLAAVDEEEAGLARILTPIAKYWICKRTPPFVYEAMECLGGNGFVEDSPLPRLFRQSPLNSIWEGSGNVIALDVVRAVRSRPSLLEVLLRQLERVRGFDVELDRAVAALPGLAGELEEAGARHFVECAALALQAAALLEAAPDIITSAFVTTRFHSPGLTFGASRSDIPCEALLERASPTAS